MSPTAIIISILIAAALLGMLAWRIAGRLFVIPCPSWLSWLLENPFDRGAAAWQTVLRLDLQPGMRVLDAGCGPGRVTIPVARQVGSDGAVTAFDIQPAMLTRARERAAAARLSNIEFVQGVLGQGRLERGRYDRALLVTVLGEIPDRLAALRELFDVLKPGGILSVTEVIYDPHYQTRGTILRLAQRVGFREGEYYGNTAAFTLNLRKPREGEPPAVARPRRGIDRHAILI